MKKIDNFTHKYPLQKTLRFKLIPVGQTEDNFNKRRILEKDNQRAEDYAKVKGYIDRYHKEYIESVLKDFELGGLSEYAEMYYKPEKSDNDIKSMSSMEASFRKKIAYVLTSQKKYKSLFGKEMIQDTLPAYLDNEEEKEIA